MFHELKWNFILEEGEDIHVKEIDKFLICGHQYAFNHDRPRIFEHRAFIDTGCGAKYDRPFKAFKWPDKKIYTQI